MQFTNKVCTHQESSQGLISNWKGLPRIDPYNCVVDLLSVGIEITIQSNLPKNLLICYQFLLRDYYHYEIKND